MDNGNITKLYTLLLKANVDFSLTFSIIKAMIIKTITCPGNREEDNC